MSTITTIKDLAAEFKHFCCSTSPMRIATYAFLLYMLVDYRFNVDFGLDTWLSMRGFTGITFQIHDIIAFAVAAASYHIVKYFKYLEQQRHIRKEHIITLEDLLRGMEAKELDLVVQPKKRLHDNRVTGVECLIRWNHPEYGIVMPDQFIPLAESADKAVMKALTEYVILRAAEMYNILKGQGHDLEFAINVSPNNLTDASIMVTITQALLNSNMPVNRLVLEVTETAIMKDPEMSIKVLVSLDSLGIKVALDDFGTGHSSFMYLKNFPVKEIKIDKSFTGNLHFNDHERTIVRSTVQLAHDIGARVVAEGVETLSTENILRELSCDYVQGYLIERAMGINDMIKWLQKNKGLHIHA